MTLSLSGIYKITNLTNGKVYVGQSQNIFMRRKQHFTQLRRGVHENKQMQEDWNHNNRGFRWDVIEYCPIEKLNEREQYWITTLNTIQGGYNCGWIPYRRRNSKKRKVKGYHKTK